MGVHEVAHQLDIAATGNEHRAGTLMDRDVSVVPAASFFIDPADIAALRLRLESP